MITEPATRSHARPLTLHPFEVRGLIAGRITQLRRPVKFSSAETGEGPRIQIDKSKAWHDRGFPDPDGIYRYQYLHAPAINLDEPWTSEEFGYDRMVRVYCTDGPGDLVWCKERFASNRHHAGPTFVYETDDPDTWRTLGAHWTPAAQMKQHSSRLTLEVLSVLPQRADQATDADGLACGARYFDGIPLDPWHRPDTKERWSLDDPKTTGNCMGSPRLALGNWWNYRYGKKDGWTSREWVWVRTVRVVPQTGVSDRPSTPAK